MHGRPLLSVTGPGRGRAGRTAVGAFAVLLAVTTTAACSGGSVTAAPHATDPACGPALGHLPAALLGLPRGTSSATGTAVYGDPEIVVRCGVTPLGPTTLPCMNVDSVDWVIDDRKDPLAFTTFGRSPALEVLIPASYPKDRDSGALVDLRAAAQALPKTSLKCG